jgi:hypothetical protein
MKYFLLENRMTPDPDDCVARVTQQETVTYDELIRMATRRGLTLTDTEMIGAINELTYTIIDVLNSGKAVDTPFVRYRPSIGGVFINKDDAFDALRHSIKINCLVGRDIKVYSNKILLEKIKYASSTPYIERIMDYSTQEENDTITPGGAAELDGELLKMDMSDPEQGVFFLNNGSATRVQIVMKNLPSTIIFNIPNNIAAGQYQLEIRNRANKKDLVLKSYLLPQLLTVK